MVKVLKYLVCSQQLEFYDIFMCEVYLTISNNINNMKYYFTINK